MAVPELAEPGEQPAPAVWAVKTIDLIGPQWHEGGGRHACVSHECG